MKRIVIASRLFAPENAAAAFRLEALADALAKKAKVEVVTTKAPEETKAAAQYKISRFPVLRDAGGNVRGYIQYMSFDMPLFARLLSKKMDVIVSEPPPTTGIVVSAISRLKKIPYYYYAADVWSDAVKAMGAPAYVFKVMHALEKIALRNAHGVIAISDGVAEQVKSFGVAADKIQIVGNGINTKAFNTNNLKELQKKSQENPYFIYTGTISEWQGAGIFLEALQEVQKKYPEVGVKFYGQGTDKAHLESLVTSLNLKNVELNELIPPFDVAQQIKGAVAALASIVPDIGYDFAKPTKIYAALACGVAPVFAGKGASSELISDNDLGYVAAYNKEEVAAKMNKAYETYSQGINKTEIARRSQWVAENASLELAGNKAAEFILK